MSQPNVTYGREIAVQTQELLGVDQYNNDVYGPAVAMVDGCVIWPTSSTEKTDGRDQVTTTLTVLLPPRAGIVPSATDTILIGGQDYEIVGEPFNWADHPFTNSRAGVEIVIRKVTG